MAGGVNVGAGAGLKQLWNKKERRFHHFLLSCRWAYLKLMRKHCTCESSICFRPPNACARAPTTVAPHAPLYWCQSAQAHKSLRNANTSLGGAATGCHSGCYNAP